MPERRMPYSLFSGALITPYCTPWFPFESILFWSKACSSFSKANNQGKKTIQMIMQGFICTFKFFFILKSLSIYNQVQLRIFKINKNIVIHLFIQPSHIYWYLCARYFAKPWEFKSDFIECIIWKGKWINTSLP